MNFTHHFHLHAYTSISPTLPTLSNINRTILITGGATGVGYAISHSFVLSGAARVIILGRRTEKLEEAKTSLTETKGSLADSSSTNPDSTTTAEILTYTCDITNEKRVKEVWQDLKAQGIEIDVLVLNATIAGTTPKGLAEEDIMNKIRGTFETNVFAALNFVDKFLKQNTNRVGAKKAIVSLNAAAAHITPIRPNQLGYASSKLALASLMSGVADNISRDTEGIPTVQVVSFHPGSIKSEAVMKSEWANAPILWSDATLPGDFAVWAASEEAQFLHGRYVWASWDIDELKAMQSLNELGNDGFLRVGLQGPKPCVGKEMFAQMAEMVKRSEE